MPASRPEVPTSCCVEILGGYCGHHHELWHACTESAQTESCFTRTKHVGKSRCSTPWTAWLPAAVKPAYVMIHSAFACSGCSTSPPSFRRPPPASDLPSATTRKTAVDCRRTDKALVCRARTTSRSSPDTSPTAKWSVTAASAAPLHSRGHLDAPVGGSAPRRRRAKRSRGRGGSRARETGSAGQAASMAESEYGPRGRMWASGRARGRAPPAALVAQVSTFVGFIVCCLRRWPSLDSQTLIQSTELTGRWQQLPRTRFVY